MTMIHSKRGGTAAIYPATRWQSIQWHDAIHRSMTVTHQRQDSDPPSGTMAILSGVTATHQQQDDNDLLREARERETREAQ